MKRKSLKDRISNVKTPYNPEAWKAMEKVLDSQKDTKRSDSTPMGYYILGLSVVLVILLFLLLSSDIGPWSLTSSAHTYSNIPDSNLATNIIHDHISQSPEITKRFPTRPDSPVNPRDARKRMGKNEHLPGSAEHSKSTQKPGEFSIPTNKNEYPNDEVKASFDESGLLTGQPIHSRTPDTPQQTENVNKTWGNDKKNGSYEESPSNESNKRTMQIRPDKISGMTQLLLPINAPPTLEGQPQIEPHIFIERKNSSHSKWQLYINSGAAQYASFSFNGIRGGIGAFYQILPLFSLEASSSYFSAITNASTDYARQLDLSVSLRFHLITWKKHAIHVRGGTGYSYSQAEKYYTSPMFLFDKSGDGIHYALGANYDYKINNKMGLFIQYDATHFKETIKGFSLGYRMRM